MKGLYEPWQLMHTVIIVSAAAPGRRLLTKHQLYNIGQLIYKFRFFYARILFILSA